MLWYKTGFLEQWQVDIGFDIAGRARVAIPIPSATKVSTLFDELKVLKARFVQTHCCQHATEATADDDNFDLFINGRAFYCPVDIGIFNKVGEVASNLLVLVVAVGTNTLVSFFFVFSSQSLWIKIKRRGVHHISPISYCCRPFPCDVLATVGIALQVH